MYSDIMVTEETIQNYEDAIASYRSSIASYEETVRIMKKTQKTKFWTGVAVGGIAGVFVTALGYSIVGSRRKKR